MVDNNKLYKPNVIKQL